MIEVAFFQTCFGPRRICPQRENLNLYVLEALNRELYARYRKIFWSENTWVIEAGIAETVRSLSRIPKDTLYMIKKVEWRYSPPGIGLRESLAHYFFDENGEEKRYNVLDLIKCFH